MADNRSLDPAKALYRSHVGALEQRHPARTHAIHDVAADVLVDVVQAARAHDGRARDDRRLAAGRLEEGAVLYRDLAAADDDAARGLVVEVLDERGPVVHARQIGAGYLQGLLERAEADDEIARRMSRLRRFRRSGWGCCRGDPARFRWRCANRPRRARKWSHPPAGVRAAYACTDAGSSSRRDKARAVVCL